MGLFSFFKSKKTLNEAEVEISISMWEDDFCQVEIIPASNKDFAENQVALLQDFSEKHYTENGFTDLYQREDITYKTPSLLIPIDQFEEILIQNKFIRIKKIQYVGGGLIDYNLGRTRVYGDLKFAIGVEIQQNIVTNIWITSYGVNTADCLNQISNMLNTLGRTFQLIIVDWNACVIVDLNDTNELDKYLKEVY